MTEAPAKLAYCGNCQKPQFWISPRVGEWHLAYPLVEGGPRSHIDMPDDVRTDYEEARAILNLSPRGACALLRLATEKLVRELQPDGHDLNDRIGRLVAARLSEPVQQALDALRVIGNEAVHPGELVLDDDIETATGLFTLLNLIVEETIARQRHIDEMYSKLPAGKLQGIIQRDREKEP